MRQLEVERRQKERVEEVRETQKKVYSSSLSGLLLDSCVDLLTQFCFSSQDEESMNMKEKVRAEITKSLKILELKCINMASLLRGLGITVGGGTSPPPNEVSQSYISTVTAFV